jgi:hypothetical protein
MKMTTNDSPASKDPSPSAISESDALQNLIAAHNAESKAILEFIRAHNRAAMAAHRSRESKDKK